MTRQAPSGRRYVGTSIRTRVFTVRWRAPWWAPTTAFKTRTFLRRQAAEDLYDRLRDGGYEVELAVSTTPVVLETTRTYS